MAACAEEVVEAFPDWKGLESNLESQNDEVSALQSFYESTNFLDILEVASEQSRFIIEANIPVELEKKPINVELWLPVDKLQNKQIENEIEDAGDSKSVPRLERTISGRRVRTRVKCEHLIPIKLTITLPEGYPSQSEPQYTLTSMWMNKFQLNRICAKLDDIWKESIGEPILFSWFEWLKQSVVEYLELIEDDGDVLICTPLNDEDLFETDNQCQSKSRAVCSFQDSEQFIYEFLRHNYLEELKLFNTSLQTCLICFDEKLGNEFYRLSGCKHHFCADCLTSMCQMHVKEGTIQLLKCPEKDCKEFVPIEIMSDILSPEEFNRWERLLLQHTLDTMGDIIYCPKCSGPIVVDNADTHAYCFACNTDYCKDCKETWHSGKCGANDQLDQRMKRLNITAEQLIHMTEHEIRARFPKIDQILTLKAKVEKKSDEEKVKSFLDKIPRCPSCKIPIEKISGCNKVICRCGTSLCYVCKQKINGYDHFQTNGKCSLWTPEVQASRIIERPVHEGQRAVERVLELMPDQKKNIIGCVTCGQRNLRLGNNNHIKCWLCSTNFCFSCRKRIVGNVSAHFKNITGCKQHS